mmetsp:Transcript_27444/g.43146  ORF Transcript_27444/g.43146 Transcript_27444/m.43146 type:complete len:122 (-) Transcript_27444:227-592(-)
MASSSILLTPTTKKHHSSSLMPSCPPPPNPPPSLCRLHNCIDVARRPSHNSTMADITNDEGEELVGFILVAPLGSNNTFVQRQRATSNAPATNTGTGVSVSSKKVLRPRPVHNSSRFESLP